MSFITDFFSGEIVKGLLSSDILKIYFVVWIIFLSYYIPFKLIPKGFDFLHNKLKNALKKKKERDKKRKEEKQKRNKREEAKNNLSNKELLNIIKGLEDKNKILNTTNSNSIEGGNKNE